MYILCDRRLKGQQKGRAREAILRQYVACKKISVPSGEGSDLRENAWASGEAASSLPHSRFLDVTQRSPLFWGALRDVQKTAVRETKPRGAPF